MSHIKFLFQMCSKSNKLTIKGFLKNDFHVVISPNPQLYLKKIETNNHKNFLFMI